MSAVLFFLGAFLSEIMGTIAGFGSSTIFLPVSLLFFDFSTSLTLVAIFHIFGNLGRIGFFRYGLDKALLIRFGVPSVIFSLAGALLVAYLNQEILKGILGVFLALYALFSLFGRAILLSPTRANAFWGGGVSGFLAGLIGTGGALRGAFLTAFGLGKEKYIATAAAVALAVDITRIPVYLSQGFLGREFFWFIPILFLIAISGSYLGKKIVDFIPQRQFTKIVLFAILLFGLKFIYDWFSSILYRLIRPN